jgi:hypothetical protein
MLLPGATRAVSTKLGCGAAPSKVRDVSRLFEGLLVSLTEDVFVSRTFSRDAETHSKVAAAE